MSTKTRNKKIFSEKLFKHLTDKIHVYDLKNELRLRVGEPNTLQFLKLMIMCYYNNILKSPFMEEYGNVELKALWLMMNMECAKKVFNQYNYLDFHPYNYNQVMLMPRFTKVQDFKRKEDDVLVNWNYMMGRTEFVMGSSNILKSARKPLKEEIMSYLNYIAIEDKKLNKRFTKIGTNLLFDIGEYGGALEKFIDLFLLIDRSEQKEIMYRKDHDRKASEGTLNRPVFDRKYLCLLTKSNEGHQLTLKTSY